VVAVYEFMAKVIGREAAEVVTKLLEIASSDNCDPLEKRVALRLAMYVLNLKVPGTFNGIRLSDLEYELLEMIFENRFKFVHIYSRRPRPFKDLVKEIVNRRAW
jgi:hypothetical protein